MAFVQAVSSSNNVTATTLTTAAITVTAGNPVALCAVISGSGNPFGSLTSSQSDTVASVVSLATSGTGSMNVALIASAVGGSTTFTVTTSGVNSTYMYIGAAEFSGRSGAYEQAASALNSSFLQSHSSPTTGSVLLADDIVVWCSDVTNGGTETFTHATGWSIPAASVQNGSAGNYPPSMMTHKDNVTAGTYTGTYTTSLFVQSATVIMALKAPTSAQLQQMLLGVG